MKTFFPTPDVNILVIALTLPKILRARRGVKAFQDCLPVRVPNNNVARPGNHARIIEALQAWIDNEDPALSNILRPTPISRRL
jgi:hypothetical protein